MKIISLKKGSPGLDGIPFWLLRDFADVLCVPLFHICNLSISSGVVPLCFKEAYITPIQKVPKPSLNDCRPIYLLPICAKVLEKLVLKHWLHTHSAKIGDLQFAFLSRKGQGTTSALTYLVH